MTFLPVVAREMNVLSRRRSTYWSRAASAMIALLVMFWVLVVASAQVSPAELGSSMFAILSTLCFGFSLLIGMQATADCLSEEKREGTLGLLFLTDLRGLDVVAGKLAASSLNAAFALLGVLPLLSLAVLLGGVSSMQLLRIAVVLLNTIFLSLSTGVFVSALSRNERKSMFACFVTLFVLTVFPWVAGAAFFNNFRMAEQVVWISPVYPFLVVTAPSTGPYTAHFFWLSLLLHHTMSWAALLAATAVLPRCVNELPATRFARLRTLLDNYVYGRSDERRWYRAALLDRNAFLWLASRERVKPFYAWVIFFFFASLFLWVWLQFTDILFDPAVGLIIMFLVHLIYKVWVTSEVCSRLIQDRRSGALELLLSSPLSVREIAAGQNLALKRIFLKPLGALIAAEFLLLILVLQHPREPAEAVSISLLFLAFISTLVLDLWALKWVGLLLSLYGRSIERVFLAAIGRVLGVPTLFFAAAGGLASVLYYGQDSSPGASVAILFWWFTGIAVSVLFGRTARSRFFREFRTAAASRFMAAGLDAAPEVKRAPAEKDEAPRISLAPVLAALRRHWILTGTATVFLLLLGIAFGRQFYWQHQVSTELARLRSAGLPTSASSVLAFFPPIPAKDNGFAMLESAGMINLGRSRFGPLRVVAGQANRPRGLAALTPDDIRVFRENLALNTAQWTALSRLTNYSRAWVDPARNDFTYGRTDLLNHMRLLEAHLSLAWHDRDMQAFEQDLHLLIHFLRLLRSQVAYSAQSIAPQGLELLNVALALYLNEKIFTEAQLARLQAGLTALEAAADLPRSLAAARGILIEFHSMSQRTTFQLPPSVRLRQGMSRLTGSEQELFYKLLASYRQAEDWARLPMEQRATIAPPSVNDPRAGEFLSFTPFPIYFALDSSGICWSDLMFHERLHLLQFALAARRYEIRMRSLPKDLASFGPNDLPPGLANYAAHPAFEAALTEGSFVIKPRSNSLLHLRFAQEERWTIRLKPLVQ